METQREPYSGTISGTSTSASTSGRQTRKETNRHPDAGPSTQIPIAEPTPPTISPSQKIPSEQTSPALILTYSEPFLAGQEHKNLWTARRRLFGNSLITALDVAAFQRETVYQPIYPWGRLLTLLEMILTSTLFALFLLAVRREFRR